MGWAGRSCSLKQHGLSVEQRWTSNFNCNFTERAANTGPLLISILAFHFFHTIIVNAGILPFSYACPLGTVAVCITFWPPRVDRSTDRPSTVPRTVTLTHVPYLLFPLCRFRAPKKNIKNSSGCQIPVQVAWLASALQGSLVISSIGEKYLVIRVDGTKFELLRRSLRIGEEQYTVDQENYNWWLYVSNAFMAAAPNEVIGGKNWNCVSGSAANLHSYYGVCLSQNIHL